MTARRTREPKRSGRSSAEGSGGRIRRVARESLGHRTLLPGQEEAIGAVLGGRDTLALLPTGGGKSAVYQLAAAERPGPTVVVSPLLALQQDQLEALDELELGGDAGYKTLDVTTSLENGLLRREAS